MAGSKENTKRVFGMGPLPLFLASLLLGGCGGGPNDESLPAVATEWASAATGTTNGATAGTTSDEPEGGSVDSGDEGGTGPRQDVGDGDDDAGTQKDTPCTDGVDCYCDLVTDPMHALFDPDLLACEDFEDPSYEDPGSGEQGAGDDPSGWGAVYGAGTTACRVAPGEYEGPNSKCLNILHDENSSDYANDGDFDCGHVPGFYDCVFQGKQALGQVCKAGEEKCGGEIGGPDFPAATTMSVTFAVRVSPGFGCHDNNCKADRVDGASLSPSLIPFGYGNPLFSSSGDCIGAASSEISEDVPFLGMKFPYGASSTSIPTGAHSDPTQLIGRECFDPDEPTSWHYFPRKADYDWNVPGGIPNHTEGDGSGQNEWICWQWSARNMGTLDAELHVWVNEKQIIRAVGIPADQTPPRINYHFLNLINTGPEVDTMMAKDNLHITASDTPVPCNAIGFDF